MKKKRLANKNIILAGSGVVIVALALIGIFGDRLGAKTYTSNSPIPSATPFKKCTLSLAEAAAIEKQIRSLQTQVNDLTDQGEELVKQSAELKAQLITVNNEIAKQKDAKKLVVLKSNQAEINKQLGNIDHTMNGISIEIHDLNTQIVTLENKLKDCTTVVFSPSPSTAPDPTPTPSPTTPPPPPPFHPTPTITPIHTPPLKK